jgi:predicted MFS family arabinose efflux permease
VKKERTNKPVTHRLSFLLAMGMSAKLLIGTNIQMFNPFLAVIAAGMGTSAVVMGRLVALRNLTGLAAPFLGSLADRVGHKTVMRVGLLATGIGMIGAAFSGNIAYFALAMILTGIGNAAYSPNLHAYLSSKLPYEKRAWGLGVVEYSWALAGIVGLFVSGYLIDYWSWKMPFYLIGSGLIVMSLLYGLLPGEEKTAEGKGADIEAADKDTARFFDLGEHAASTWGCILSFGFMMFAMMHIIIIHGGWLQTEYGLSPSRLGSVALLLGFFDLIASVVVSVAVDRIGKRKSVLIGVAGMTASFVLFPFLNQGLVPALVGLSISRCFFEFAIVSSLPLLSEQAPRHRGKVLSLSLTAGLMGTTAAGLTGPAAYIKFGVWGLGLVSLASSVIALLLIIFVVRERPYSSTKPCPAQDA